MVVVEASVSLMFSSSRAPLALSVEGAKEGLSTVAWLQIHKQREGEGWSEGGSERVSEGGR